MGTGRLHVYRRLLLRSILRPQGAVPLCLRQDIYDHTTEAGGSVKEAPMATCPVDGEPLVATVEFPKKEWICVVCRRTYAFFDPTPAPPTPELNARYEELAEQYRSEKAARS